MSSSAGTGNGNGVGISVRLVIPALLAMVLGSIPGSIALLRGSVTRSEMTDFVERNSPYREDRAMIEARLKRLEAVQNLDSVAIRDVQLLVSRLGVQMEELSREWREVRTVLLSLREAPRPMPPEKE